MKTPRSKSCILTMGMVVCVATCLIFFRWTGIVTSVPPYIYPCIQNGTWTRQVHSSPSDTLEVEDWQGHQLDDSDPLNVPYTVHYLWCGDAEAKFRFKDYLSLTSVVRVLQPVKVILHYTVLPRDDSYNTWSALFSMSTPALHLQPLNDSTIPCGSEEMLDAVLAILEPQGGIFVGQGVILARAPTDFSTGSLATHFSDSPDKTRGVLYASRRFPDPDTRLELLELIRSSPASCVSEDAYNQDIAEDPFCISVSDSVLYPKDIMFSESRFAELARWLFYGKRAPVVIKKDPDNLIPRISHYIKLSGQNEYSSELNFNHFLNMLSALYIGGFRHVYLHAEEEPRGQWWEELQSESVTWVKIEPIDTVFRQDIRQKAHVSDVIRFLILYKYGGAYQDFDVTWVSHVNDSLLACAFVHAYDWVINGEWPEYINNGVMFSRRHSEWLRLFIETLREYRDEEWNFNSGLVPYKMFEKHPDLVCLDRHVQVLCHGSFCYPPWHEDYRRPLDNSEPTSPFSFRDVYAIHTTKPKLIPSLQSPQSLKVATDTFGQFMRDVLMKCGKSYLLQ